MKPDFELILEECLAQIRSGKALDECLSQHPDEAEQLRPLLEAAVHVSSIPVPRARPAAVKAGLEKLLTNASTQVSNPSTRPGHSPESWLHALSAFLLGRNRAGWIGSSWGVVFRFSVALVLVLLATGSLTIGVSASSLPGDKLYPVKRTWESIRLALTISQENKLQLQDQFAAERRGEVKQLIQLGRAGTVEFQAPLEEMNAEQWLVDGFQVLVNSDTKVVGTPEPGLAVTIRARLESNGTLKAIQVQVPITARSTPHPSISPITSPTPTGESNSDKHEHQPNASKTPSPTQEHHEELPTLEPSDTSEHSASPTPPTHPARTPEPTEKHKNQRTPEPTEGEQITHTPEPTGEHLQTPEPTEIQHEHETPRPTATQEDHETPRPTEGDHQTPQPTEDH